MKVIFILIIMLIISSCASTITISTDSNDLDGIPFYIHKSVVKQETRFLYNWLVISLIREEKINGNIPKPILTKRVRIGQDLSQLNQSLGNLNNSDDIENDLKNVLSKINSLETASLNSKYIVTDNLIDNKWFLQTVVDYSTKYYLNSTRPWFGSSTLSQKIASNGTLSEATSTIDNQIDELITGVVGLASPISSVITSQIENKDSKQDTSSNTKSINKSNTKILPENIFKIIIEEEGYIYTFIKIYELEDAVKAYTPLEFNLNKGNYTRSIWTKDEKGTEAKKEEKPTINISGSIQLPVDVVKSSGN